MTDKMREVFEKMSRRFGIADDQFKQDEDGCYLDKHTQSHWVVFGIAWAESRDALMITRNLAWRAEAAEKERDMLKAEVDSLTREADRQYTTIEAYRKNAERYCWLRDMHIGDDPESINLDSAAKKGLDSAIDAAMRKEASNG